VFPAVLHQLQVQFLQLEQDPISTINTLLITLGQHCERLSRSARRRRPGKKKVYHPLLDSTPGFKHSNQEFANRELF